jgi:hypothetical protein
LQTFLNKIKQVKVRMYCRNPPVEFTTANMVKNPSKKRLEVLETDLYSRCLEGFPTLKQQVHNI